MRTITIAEVLLGCEVPRPHIRLCRLRVLPREEEAEFPDHLALKASGTYFPGEPRGIGNRDFTLIGCTQSLTCSWTQGRSSNWIWGWSDPPADCGQPPRGQKATVAPPRDIDTDSSHFWSSFSYVDTGVDRGHCGILSQKLISPGTQPLPWPNSLQVPVWRCTLAKQKPAQGYEPTHQLGLAASGPPEVSATSGPDPIHPAGSGHGLSPQWTATTPGTSWVPTLLTSWATSAPGTWGLCSQKYQVPAPFLRSWHCPITPWTPGQSTGRRYQLQDHSSPTDGPVRISSKDITKKLLEFINGGKVGDTLIYENLLHLYTLSTNYQKDKSIK